MDVLLRSYVLHEGAGLHPNRDVRIIGMAPDEMDAALDSGQVDAAFTWEPFVTRSLYEGNS